MIERIVDKFYPPAVKKYALVGVLGFSTLGVGIGAVNIADGKDEEGTRLMLSGATATMFSAYYLHKAAREQSLEEKIEMLEQKINELISSQSMEPDTELFLEPIDQSLPDEVA